jgi:lipoate-protein ligase B
MVDRPRPAWYIADLGTVDYAPALDLQHRLAAARADGALPAELLILIEHPPVFTLGRRGGRENLKVPPEVLECAGVPVIQAERGGVITYHGPGQIVLYAIVHLAAAGLSVVGMVERLEEVMIRTCAAWGIAAGRNALNRGAWVGPRKIGSIGLAVRRGVSFHGMALNAAVDLTHFGWISPCGLDGVAMTSMHLESDRPVAPAAVRRTLGEVIAEVFAVRLEPIGAARVAELAARQGSDDRRLA